MNTPAARALAPFAPPQIVSAAEREAVAAISASLDAATADLAYHHLKTSGELWTRNDRRALVDQIKAGVL